MRKLTRLAIIGGATTLALALSAPALAAFTPRLDVSVPNGLNAAAPVKIHAAVGPTDESTARLVIYSAVRFAVNGGTPVSVIGTVDARVRAGDLGGAIVPVPGEIEVRAPHGHCARQRRRRAAGAAGDDMHGHDDAHRLLGLQAQRRRQCTRAGSVLRRHRRRGTGARHVEDHDLPASGRRPGRYTRALAARDQAHRRRADVQPRASSRTRARGACISGRRSGRRTTRAWAPPTPPARSRPSR